MGMHYNADKSQYFEQKLFITFTASTEMVVLDFSV